jgi:dissimilatory sulfite reductase (desulfoviridin) alpha/beta subunit
MTTTRKPSFSDPCDISYNGILSMDGQLRTTIIESYTEYYKDVAVVVFNARTLTCTIHFTNSQGAMMNVTVSAEGDSSLGLRNALVSIGFRCPPEGKLSRLVNACFGC